ncbi:unnamed protein product [Clonostachys rhizophaga]|uniref:alpha-L-rhamnosidase n=1 Tax=Clonostachys rhizophaga TaxID=160324 RepID=A0A9N9Y949_9HYPO|nr:unnamed protein product [Clonostachys rhizophaga]
MAPGWTSYAGRIQYQTYDVLTLLKSGQDNCIGVRVAEGWFSGRLGFRGGHRDTWGSVNALLMQLELTFQDGAVKTVATDQSWMVTRGPIRLAEIYDGEKYDATLEVVTLSALPEATQLVASCSEPVRRTEVIRPKDRIVTPSGNIILDFGQNLVGYLRLKDICGPRGHKTTLRQAEVLENGELGTRPLRFCDALDQYTLKGSEDEQPEIYEPRFTIHGFRYAQIDGWVGDLDLATASNAIEAVVCHTDMRSIGGFSCSNRLLNQLYKNVVWGMKGNFLSVPTDCPQRDERLGWTGDLALFAPTALLIYDCTSMIRNWLVDVEFDQDVLGGVPPMDWLDPTAPPDQPWKGATDARMVSNMFLIHSLDLMVQISAILDKTSEEEFYAKDCQAAREEFQAEFVTANGRAGERLVELVRKNEFKISTGFAGTPYVCAALAATGNIQVAYAMLLEKNCPSWLYPVTMGATTVWERWDSMHPDGSINSGNMTSFNHYAFGAIAKFMYEKVAGLQQLEPGWTKFRIAPSVGADFESASAVHESRYGLIKFSWETKVMNGGKEEILLEATIPSGTRAEIVLPQDDGELRQEVGSGRWNLRSTFIRNNGWPVTALPPKS